MHMNSVQTKKNEATNPNYIYHDARINSYDKLTITYKVIC